jgi:hypothetical protein
MQVRGVEDDDLSLRGAEDDVIDDVVEDTAEDDDGGR